MGFPSFFFWPFVAASVHLPWLHGSDRGQKINLQSTRFQEKKLCNAQLFLSARCCAWNANEVWRCSSMMWTVDACVEDDEKLWRKTEKKKETFSLAYTNDPKISFSLCTYGHCLEVSGHKEKFLLRKSRLKIRNKL
jgi:hypothetical protein